MAITGITGYSEGVLLTLSPLERLNAMRSSFNGGSTSESFFILFGIIAIIVLLGILFGVHLNRLKREKNSSDLVFMEYAQSRGLTISECQKLLDMAIGAKLKRNESIFNASEVFDCGAWRMMEKCRIDDGFEKSEQLRIDLSCLREKLGFETQINISKPAVAPASKEVSSRNILVGKNIYIKHHNMADAGDILATVIKNDESGLTVEFTEPVEVDFGQIWRGRYCASDSLWEFDTSVIKCSGHTVVLKHSDNVRFINRRRFLRVPVRSPAYVASFEFMQSQPINSGKNIGRYHLDQANSKLADTLEQPHFVPAIVTELGGPGLRVEADLKVKTGDRVLIVFKLTENNGTIEKIVKDVGVVRHVIPIDNGLSIALELKSLTDANISELIRAANSAFISANEKLKDVPVSRAMLERVPVRAGV